MRVSETDGLPTGFELGSPGLRSVGPLTFSPDGVLFVADNAQARIVALDFSADDQKIDVVELDNLDERLAAVLGCAVGDVFIRGLATHPLSGAPYLSVMRGSGESAVPLLIMIGDGGALSEVGLDRVGYASTSIEDAPAADDIRLERYVVPDGDPQGTPLEVPQAGVTVWVGQDSMRNTTVTDLAFVGGELLVAGASNEEFVSTLRRIPVPFGGQAQTSSLEIFHVSHGQYETQSPIRTFVACGGGAGVLASYTCTPMVYFPLSDLAGSATHVVGRTVADLGAASSPLDMVCYSHAGEEYALVSNARHPLMKIACRDIDAQSALTQAREDPATLQQPVGVPREMLPHKGVTRMAVADGHVLMLQRDDAGLHLRAYSSASL